MERRKMIGQIRKCLLAHRYEEGVLLAEKAMELMPESAVVHNLMGELMEKQNRDVEAIRQYRQACMLDSRYRPAHFNLKRYGIILGMPDR
ncbi:MAG: hypothetical protein ACI32N_01355 [Bulleidia sp.]